MHWNQFAREQPGLAALGQRRLGQQRLGGPGVVLVGTVRADGTARISPVEPLFWEDDLWLSMLWGSRKAADLLRDPRVLVHSIVVSRDGTPGEYKLRGRAIVEDDAHLQARYAAAVKEQVGWNPVPGRFHLFWIDVEGVSFIRYDDASGDQFVTKWPPGTEYVRRATSPTSLGDAEPYSEILKPGSRL
jgi:hypothetical protein